MATLREMNEFEAERSDNTNTVTGSSLPHLHRQELDHNIERRHKAKYRRLRLVTGVLIPYALVTLDTTITATALSYIAADFKTSEISWVISAFNLTSASLIPIWGQVADAVGRHNALAATLAIMAVGSALCTSAPTSAFGMLIFGRSIQGIAVAGINVICRVIVNDAATLDDSAKNNIFVTIVTGVLYACGPVIGGQMTEKSWRWCFAIHIPLSLLGIAAVRLFVRPFVTDQLRRRHGSPLGTSNLRSALSAIDLGGQTLFLSAMTLLALALTWGGSSYPWKSARVLSTLVGGVSLTFVFILWEYMLAPGHLLSRKLPRQQPMVPWSLMKDRNFTFLLYVNFASGAAMIPPLYFVNIYFSLMENIAPSKAGTNLLYYIPGLGVGVYMAITMTQCWPRQTFSPLLLGSILEATGATVLTWAISRRRTGVIFGMMGLTGAGTGLHFFPVLLHGVGFFPSRVTSVISMIAFVLPTGSMVAITLMGTVFNSNINLPSGMIAGKSQSNVYNNTEEQHSVQENTERAISLAFMSIVPILWLSAVAAMFLGNIPINKKEDSEMERVASSPFPGYHLLMAAWQRSKDST
ncbi:major facilitator superfamily domain-containing protein [Lophiotrema nucula]|uniref:Major facilitator superfamily domain-containing protein n=1 Tax=Lophiotrema nucula TaxID=690887 RepID=A0A6A5YMP6_9PLEO|nr:major facilitator superfamily domain-containing protein [Lophiotrema nucula]